LSEIFGERQKTMRITKYNVTKEYIKQLQEYAKTIAPSLRIVFNDMKRCKDYNNICVSYEIDVHEQNAIQAEENKKEELKASPKTSDNKRQHGSKIRRLISWIAGLFRPKMEMPIEKIIERLGLMEKYFVDSPAPEFAETAHYAIEALRQAQTNAQQPQAGSPEAQPKLPRCFAYNRCDKELRFCNSETHSDCKGRVATSAC
jgi:hypothetical protein